MTVQIILMVFRLGAVTPEVQHTLGPGEVTCTTDLSGAYQPTVTPIDDPSRLWWLNPDNPAELCIWQDAAGVLAGLTPIPAARRVALVLVDADGQTRAVTSPTPFVNGRPLRPRIRPQ